jgi:hypothetical protein
MVERLVDLTAVQMVVTSAGQWASNLVACWAGWSEALLAVGLAEGLEYNLVAKMVAMRVAKKAVMWVAQSVEWTVGLTAGLKES